MSATLDIVGIPVLNDNYVWLMPEPQSGATNPFLRADVPAVQRAVGMTGGDPVSVFAEVRHRKDMFR